MSAAEIAEGTVSPRSKPTPESSGVARQRHNRALVVTLVLSALAHLAVLLWERGAPIFGAAATAVPDLRFWIESTDDTEIDAQVADAANPRAPAIAPVTDLPEPRPDMRDLAAHPMPLDAASHAEPPDELTASSDDAPAAPAHETSATGSPPTDGDSAASVAVVRNPIEPTASVAQMTASERRMLANRIQNWARKLDGVAPGQAQLTWREKGREYTAELRRVPAATDMDLERVVVEVTTVEEGIAKNARMTLKRLAFSHFAQLVDSWDAVVMLHDDTIVGRFHSNSLISLGWDRETQPTFRGLVTTTENRIVIAQARGFRRRSAIFSQGIEMNSPRIVLPRNFFAASVLQRVRDAEVLELSGDVAVAFHPDGGLEWRPAGSAAAHRVAPSSRPRYLIAGDRSKVRVSGVVRGTVLVYSAGDITVIDDLVYANDPRIDHSSADYLGLVSDQRVVIARPEETGPGDLTIQAAIYARQRFEVLAERSSTSGTLHIYGSLSAGSISATEPRYATRLEFDPRFELQRPPGFPLTNRYDIEQWNAEWNVASD